MERLTDDERDAVECELKYVRIVVRRMTKAGRKLDEDELQAGVLGLMKAIQAFDPRAGQFAHHAYRLINNAVVDFRASNRLMRVPRKQYTEGARAPLICAIDSSPDGWPMAIAAPRLDPERELRMSAAAQAVAALGDRPRSIVEGMLDGRGPKSLALEHKVPIALVRKTAESAQEQLRSDLTELKPSKRPYVCPMVKIKHKTKADARRWIYHLRSIGSSQPEKGRLSEYWCRECRAYHIGHTRSSAAKRIEMSFEADAGKHPVDEVA